MADASASKRFPKLLAAFRMTVDKSLSTCSREEFLNCFPDLAEAHKKTLLKIYEQFMHILRQNVETEFGVILSELDMDQKLAKLEKLMQQQDVISDSSQYSAVRPEDYVRQRIIPLINKEKENLGKTVSAMTEENRKLLLQLKELQEQHATLQAKVQSQITQFAGAAEIGAEWERSEGKKVLEMLRSTPSISTENNKL